MDNKEIYKRAAGHASEPEAKPEATVNMKAVYVYVAVAGVIILAAFWLPVLFGG